jgi:hypothetical protein
MILIVYWFLLNIFNKEFFFINALNEKLVFFVHKISKIISLENK